MLGGDKNCTICTLITIEGRCGCIFQNGHMVNILSYHILNGTLNAIDKDERCTATQTLQSTYIESRIGHIEQTCSLKGYQSVTLADDIVANITRTAMIDILIGNDAHSGRRLLAGKCPVSTNINRLRLKCSRIYYFILRHCWQAEAC